MGIQRAADLYLVASPVTDSDAGGDIRFLSGTGSFSGTSQSVQFTHTNDDVSRTFDPQTTGATANLDPLVLQRLGWATRLTEDMTPADDSNCNAMLSSGSLTVDLQVSLDQSGGSYVAGSYGPTLRASLWAYDPATNAGTRIAIGTNSAVTWDYTPVTGDLGDTKAVPVTITLPSDYEIPQGRVLLLQVGLGTGTVPNPTLGTATWTCTLHTDSVFTAIRFATGQGIRQWCRLASSPTGRGAASRGALLAGLSRTPVGRGAPSHSRQTVVAKTFSLAGKGVVAPAKQVSAFRTSSLTGAGSTGGTITLPLDEVPTGEATTETVAPPLILVDGRPAVAVGDTEYTEV